MKVWNYGDSFEDFKKIYNAVVSSSKYAFLYIDRAKSEFRINFDKVLEEN